MSHYHRFGLLFGPLTALALLLAFGWLSPARAQEGTATVAGTGSATIKRPASKLRMTMVLSAKGKTLEEAIEKLKDRREIAAAHLKKLQAEAAGTKFGETALAVEGRERSQMQRMMRMQMARGGKVPKGLDLPPAVAVHCSLTAEWPLKYQSADELLVLSKQLQDKIKEADLGGLKEPKQLTPQEQELEEELANAGRDEFNPYGEQEAPPGEPAFVFVATITKEERATALAEAFTKAKGEAGRVAAAAGLTLGTLIEVSGHSSVDISAGLDPYTAYQLRQRGGQGAESAEDEATSPVPGPVTAMASVQAKFRAK